MDAGCDLHMSKPVKKGVMLDTIRSVALMRSGSAPALEDAAKPVVAAVEFAAGDPNGSDPTGTHRNASEISLQAPDLRASLRDALQ